MQLLVERFLDVPGNVEGEERLLQLPLNRRCRVPVEHPVAVRITYVCDLAVIHNSVHDYRNIVFVRWEDVDGVVLAKRPDG